MATTTSTPEAILDAVGGAEALGAAYAVQRLLSAELARRGVARAAEAVASSLMSRRWMRLPSCFTRRAVKGGLSAWRSAWSGNSLTRGGIAADRPTAGRAIT